VYSEYGIVERTTGEYEVDHDVPLEAGGSNDIANLWPEAAEPRPGFHEKDQVENYLHDQGCAGTMSCSMRSAQLPLTGWTFIGNNLSERWRPSPRRWRQHHRRHPRATSRSLPSLGRAQVDARPSSRRPCLELPVPSRTEPRPGHPQQLTDSGRRSRTRAARRRKPGRSVLQPAQAPAPWW
jgi:hypothetical protein